MNRAHLVVSVVAGQKLKDRRTVTCNPFPLLIGDTDCFFGLGNFGAAYRVPELQPSASTTKTCRPTEKKGLIVSERNCYLSKPNNRGLNKRNNKAVK
ncbi:hypothetical protein OSTOST_02733 [Ostertagia ostertagi]